MGCKPEGTKDCGASDARDARLCACSRSTWFKKASGVFDGKTRRGFRGGERAFRAPLIGYEAYGMHRAENSQVGATTGRGRPAEGERTDLLHGLHCLDIVGGLW